MKPLGEGLGTFGAAMLKSQSPMSNLPPLSISPSGGADRPPGGGADRPPGGAAPGTGPARQPGTGTGPGAVDPTTAAALQGAGAALSGAGEATGQMGGDLYAMATQYQAQVERFLKMVLEQKKAEREANEQISRYAHQLASAKTENDIEKTTIESLHQAVGAMKRIAMMLRTNAMFWRQMRDHCANLKKSDLGEKITLYMKESLEFRRMMYLESDFMTAAVTYLAGWRAIEVIAGEYGVACGTVRAQIQEDLAKNPSTEASIKLAPALAANLLAHSNQDGTELAGEMKLLEAQLALSKAQAA